MFLTHIFCITVAVAITVLAASTSGGRAIVFFNRQMSKEKYSQFLKGLSLHCWHEREKLSSEFSEFLRGKPHPHFISRMAENATGNYIFQSRNALESFFVRDCENVKFCFSVEKAVKDCQDFSFFGNGAELLYECVVSGLGAYRLLCCYDCWNNVSELLYCGTCVNSKSCFGCVGLRNKQFCILNKQYSEEEYCSLVPRIIEHMRTTGEWGEFFPCSLSPVPYNESVAYRYFPLSRAEADTRGLSWYEKPLPNVERPLSASDLPDEIEGLVGPLYVSTGNGGTIFLISASELQRYQRLKVPLPRIPYDARMEARIRRLGGLKLFSRTCARNGDRVCTTISPEEPWSLWSKGVFDKEYD